ncbi:MAG: RNA polymerase sigma factor [Verrucomicrobia bacterium]|jgi:RNA polymerase sigma-70 factor (ECF subfamily)|nr:RNA polymerase sigma factor [Verrucomicrobiota bacterium]OQC65547.1 MAG: ECF RNA polymerase sigma factor SigL [Verrucomicrobia bacterium ADurb.Bin006]MDI9381660.1 RNA polymerase sigma factor [Verrucomicrobiota bacterium]NMD19298.1 RNA polymerase sigma factor [Verrucomicrobiota bacterium]HNU98634.1 RNA polymerase sigma factor [Verrucomicrobiota bacterium]
MPAASDLERIYDDHAQALFAFALDLTRSEADTRDLLQEMFRRLAVRPLRDANVRDARAFLLRMAHNLWVDQVRRHSTRERVRNTLATAAEPVFAPADDPDSETFRRELDAAFAELPPEQRAVVHLKLWEEMTFESISRTLDIPLNTAASRYRYGLDKLRARLRPLYAEIQ